MQVRPNENARDISVLSPNRQYYVIGLDDESFRVVDDKGEPVLFPRSVFDVLDDSIPPDWVWKRFGDDEYYADPPGLDRRGFYENYFDGREEAVRQFESYLRSVGLGNPV